MPKYLGEFRSTVLHSVIRGSWFNMQLYLTFFVICLAIPIRSGLQHDDEYLRFPEGFRVGAAGSSYQIEGGWNASDKGENVWDRYTHTQPWKIEDRSTGDIACDSYHKYKEDVQAVKGIGLDHYRFSISWSRILPNGSASSVSQDGLRYYHNLIDELLANDIEPIVSLYHFDHPQVLEDMGGWLNDSMVDRFAEYADIIFREYGPKVKVFTTINEPKVVCLVSYVRGIFAPGKSLHPSAQFLCAHNVLKAHARAYHLYDQKYRPNQNGMVGTALVCSSYHPKRPNETFAAEISFQLDCGLFAHPIYIGDYPEIVKTRLREMSRDAGLPESMLPEFSPEWIKYIKGTSDYFGLNHYKTFLVELGPDNDVTPALDFIPGIGVSASYDPSWVTGAMNGTAKIAPEGLGHLLRTIKNKYNNPPVYILENGMSAEDEILNDYKRIEYHYLYLREILLAIKRDGCNVQKYTVWSLLDNFEWIFGYAQKFFGLVHVNYTSPNLERVPKLSASWLKNVMHTRQLQPPLN